MSQNYIEKHYFRKKAPKLKDLLAKIIFLKI